MIQETKTLQVTPAKFKRRTKSYLESRMTSCLKATSTSILTLKSLTKAFNALSSEPTPFTNKKSKRSVPGTTTWSYPQMLFLRCTSGTLLFPCLLATPRSPAHFMLLSQGRIEGSKYLTTLWTYFSFLISYSNSSRLTITMNKRK